MIGGTIVGFHASPAWTLHCRECGYHESFSRHSDRPIPETCPDCGVEYLPDEYPHTPRYVIYMDPATRTANLVDDWPPETNSDTIVDQD